MRFGTTCTDKTMRAFTGARHHMFGLSRAYVPLGKGGHFTERQREVEWRMVDGTEIRIQACRLCRIVGDDGEVDLFGFGHLNTFA